MEEIEIKNTTLYRTMECTIKQILKENIDDILDNVMPLFEPFIEEGDSIKGFNADTPEEAIDKAYNWFHSTFCNG